MEVSPLFTGLTSAGSTTTLSRVLVEDLSWLEPFTTVNISKLSERPGPDCAPLVRWRVVVGANGHHVEADAPGLTEALTLCRNLVYADPVLRMMLGEEMS